MANKDCPFLVMITHSAFQSSIFSIDTLTILDTTKPIPKFGSHIWRKLLVMFKVVG